MTPCPDAWGRARACGVCRAELPRQRGEGRPPKYCRKPRCQRIAERARRRTGCGRCGTPLRFADERLRALCGLCLRDVAGQLPLLETHA